MMILPFIEMGSLKDLMAESNDAIIDRYLAQMVSPRRFHSLLSFTNTR